ncbi:MAG: hypothetical protein ABIJ47_11590 [Candidatus Bathyarchaeota archaeon]
MSDPFVSAAMGFALGLALGLVGGLDALLRAGRAGAVITTKRQAVRWLLGNPEEAEA